MATTWVIGAPSALAQGPTLTVETGYAGRHRSGTDLLIQIEIDADRLIDGELVIASRFGEIPGTVVVPVELAGGARKRFFAVVPSISQGMGLSVQLIEGGELLASQTINPQTANEDELVGVMASRSDNMPGTAQLAVPLGTALLAPLSDAILASGPGSVDALGIIVASAQDLSTLSPSAREALTRWVHDGGELAVDEAPGPVPGFNVNADATRTSVGRGGITSTNGVFAQGMWDGVLLPSSFPQDAFGPGGLTGELTGDMMWFGGPLENALANDAGFGLPSTKVVLPIMALYVLVIGPLSFLTLRRLGRPQLLWIALPALALLFTAGVWVAGSALRSNTNDSHGTIIEVADGYASARSSILRSSRNGGTTTLELPTGWSQASGSDFRFGPPGSGGSGNVRSVGGDILAADLDAGGFAMFAAEGPALDYATALEVVASSAENGTITGTVTNQLNVQLEEVAIFAPFQGINVGTIGPGETLGFELSGSEANPRFGQPIDMTVWQDATNVDFGPFGPQPTTDSPVSIELWTTYLTEHIGQVRELGTVTAVGWTRDLAAPLDSAIERGRTAIVARADVEAPAGLTDMASTRVLIRGAEQTGFQQNFGPGFTVATVWRFDLPANVDAADVALELPRQIVDVELWDGTEWLVLEDADSGLFQIPPGAFIQGSLFVKPTVDFERNPSLGRDFSLQRFGSDELRTDFLDLANDITAGSDDTELSDEDGS